MKDPYFPQRTAVVDLSQALLDEGLVVRTWGNVSHRTEGTSFVITPSGRSYETMIETDLAVVDADGESHGPFKASSEYPMHKLCYELRPSAKTVVHTHQRYASALSQLGRDLVLTAEEAAAIGQERIRISPYGLPSTKKLHQGVEHTLATHPEDNVVLLEAHGVFLCGDTPEHALQLARDVEKAARRIYQELTGSDLVDLEQGHGTVASSRKLAGSVSGREPRGSTPEVQFLDASGASVAPTPAERDLHKRIYARRKDIGAIRVCADSEVEALIPNIEAGQDLKPFLDDYAQIIGVRAGRKVSRANLVVVDGRALCLGSDMTDATAVESVLKKNARAARVAQASGRSPIAAWECLLMNVIYKVKYSKQAG